MNKIFITRSYLCIDLYHLIFNPLLFKTSPGESLKDKKRALMNISLSVDYDLWLKRLDTQLNGPIIQNSLKFLKIVESTKKKKLPIIKLWGLV